MKSGINVIILVTILLQSSSSDGWNWDEVDPQPTTSTTTTRTPTTTNPFPTTVPFPTPSTTSNPDFAKCMKRCPSTSEYDPVCGTDDMTYHNENKLLCAIQCGRKISKKHAGMCVMRPTSSTTQSSVGPTSPIPSTTTSRSYRKCIKRCPSTNENDPVCGTDRVTYQNLSKLWCAKKCGTLVEKLHDGPCSSFTTSTTTSTTQSSVTPDPKCIKGCSVTPQYDPVCGTNGRAYDNESKLRCAQQCGVKVDLAYEGTCNRRPPTTSTTTQSPVKSTTLPPNFDACIRQCIVSFDYKPVCGTDGVSYENETILQCDAHCGKDVEKLRDGSC